MNDDGNDRLRLLTALWVDWCNCNGPQPSLSSTRAEQHAADCEYVARIPDDSATVDESVSVDE